MNHKLFTTLSGLAISGLLLLVGLMASPEATRLSGGAEDGSMAVAIEGGAIQAGEEAVGQVERKPRRSRQSLSMPYFSFAQSLRPRG